MELTDEQVLEHLLNKKDRLKNDLSRVEIAINALRPYQIEVTRAQPKKTILDSSDIKEKEIESKTEIVGYSKSFKAADQLKFALAHLVSASTLEMADFIYQLDKRVTKERLQKRLKDIASREHSAKRLYADKTDKRYKYSLLKDMAE